MKDEVCITCAHWKPDPPSGGWHEFSVYDLANHLELKGHQITRAGWPGRCTLVPEWRETKSSHSCGYHKLAELFMLSWLGFMERMGSGAKHEKRRIELRDERAKSKALRARLRKPKA